ELIDELADDCFMPFTVGGGIRSVSHVGRLLEVGADKVAIGTAAVEEPAALAETAKQFGSQCVVAVIDVTRDDAGSPTVMTRSGTLPTERDPVELARCCEDMGAGEILLQSVDRDGTMSGYDLEVIAVVSDAVSIPVIASGGAGTYDDLLDALGVGASAVAASAMFHFTEQTPLQAKARMDEAGYPVRR
ncbi:MAG: nitronate monooxygenase, partial [Microthrixaceae bacterium]|nr:nitronate monooxygenase [Microthrixaceae bacterium]